jgi:hypothetical protein
MTRRLLVFAALGLLVGCDKDKKEIGPAVAQSTATTTAPVVTPSPSVSPIAALSVATSLVVAADAGKPKSVAGPVSRKVEGKNYALELAAQSCKAGSECAMTIKLVAVGEYHVNKEYPYKFAATAAPGLEFVTKAAPNTFTREAGDFVEQGEKTGTMSVRFKAASAGDAHVAGTYKFSVCSADQCQIEQEKLDFVVPVM